MPEMNRDDAVSYCLAKPGSFEDYPFEPDLPVVKVGPPAQAKMFALFGLDPKAAADNVSLRCWPEEVQAWRSKYPESIGSTPYMRTRAWNTVLLDGSVDPGDLREMIDMSYDSAVAALPRKYRPAGAAP